VEAHSSLNKGEQAHGPLRRVNEKPKATYPKLRKQPILSLSTEAINDTANVHGMVPTFLVYGLISKLPIAGQKYTYVNQRMRMKALADARDEYPSIVATRRLEIASDVRGPGEHSLSEGDMTLVFREDSKRWEGPVRVISLDAGVVVHVLDRVACSTHFSRPNVRPFNPPGTTPSPENADNFVSCQWSENHENTH
jgi:hypothetical protein